MCGAVREAAGTCYRWLAVRNAVQMSGFQFVACKYSCILQVALCGLRSTSKPGPSEELIVSVLCCRHDTMCGPPSQTPRMPALLREKLP